MTDLRNNDRVKEILKDCNIALIGFANLTEMKPDARFGFPYGVSIAIALQPDIVALIPDGPTMEYYNEYKNVSARLREASAFLADQIKERGFGAMSLSVQNQSDDFRTPFPLKTLATRSGLGWIGKAATLVTRQFGSAVRLGGVLTDMPFLTGTPINESLCGDCAECVTHCPGKAVSGKTWTLRTDRDELLNAAGCKRTVIQRGKPFGITDGSCGVCLAVCPYTKKYTERIRP